MSREAVKPYAHAAGAYWRAGWTNPLPILGKKVPPKGYTGYEGRAVAWPDLQAWIDGPEAERNVAVRSQGTWIGIDVDAHDGKDGADTIGRAQASLGPLPPSYSSTSRGPAQPSRINFYRVPVGSTFNTAQAQLEARFGAHVDILHPGHRYAMVWPSVHPDTGEVYAWYGPDGEQCDVPRLLDCAELPPAWLDFLTTPSKPGRTAEEVLWDEPDPRSGPIKGGKRHDSLMRYACHLLATSPRLTLREYESLCFVRWTDCEQPPKWHHEWTWDEARENPVREVWERYGSGDVWEPPTPVDEIDRTPLPDGFVNSVNGVRRFPEGLWRFVDAVAASLQVPRDMVFMLVLSILSTASGGRWRARISQDWLEPLALMTVTSLPSGSRKSAAVKATAAPLYEVERALIEAARPKILEAQALRDLRTAEVEQLKRKAARGPVAEADLVGAMMAVDEADVPALPRLLADDITPEKLGTLMAEQGGRMGVVSAEGGIFAILSGRYSSGQPNLDLVLKAHAGDPARVDRIGRPSILISEPFLSIGVTVQPDIIEGLSATQLLRGAGLLARFLYAMPRSLVGHRDLDPDPVPFDVAQEYADRIVAVANRAAAQSDVVDLKLTDGAALLLRAFRQVIEPKLDPNAGELADIHDWASKLPGQLVRIAALLQLFDSPTATEVSETAMEAAIDLADYLAGQAVAAFDAINGRHSRSNQPRAVLAWLRRKRYSEFTVRTARRELNGQPWAQDVERLRDVLDDLEDLGWIRRVEQPSSRGPGRPSERYMVNPATFKERRTS